MITVTNVTNHTTRTVKVTISSPYRKSYGSNGISATYNNINKDSYQSPMPSDEELNDIVRFLGFAGNDNIVNNYHDGVSSGDDNWNTLENEAFKLGAVDQAASLDKFSYWYERDIDLSLLDSEASIQEAEDKLEANRAKWLRWKKWLSNNKHSEFSKEQFSKFTERCIRQSKALEERKIKLDKSLVSAEPKEINTPSEGLAMYTFLEMYIDQMSLGQMTIAIDVIEGLQKAGELSWYYYVQCGMALSFRLARATVEAAGWWSICDRFRKWNKDNFRPVLSPTSEDSLYASMSISMESALDMVRAAKQLADKNYMSTEDMYCSMIDNLEERTGVLEAWQTDTSMWDSFIEESITGFNSNSI